MARFITRRSFLKATLASTATLCLGCPINSLYARTAPAPEEARFYDRRGKDTLPTAIGVVAGT